MVGLEKMNKISKVGRKLKNIKKDIKQTGLLLRPIPTLNDQKVVNDIIQLNLFNKR